MSDTNQTPESAEAVAKDQGYSTAPPAINKNTAAADAEVKRRNLRATFGSGPGKMALIAVAVVVVVFGSIAASGMRKTPLIASDTQVDAPSSPANRVTNNAVTQQEAARRAEQSQREADEANVKGQSYQPSFDVNIGENNKAIRPESSAHFAGFEASAGNDAATPHVDGSARTLTNSTTPNQATAQANAQQQAEQQRRDQEIQRATDKLAAEQKIAESERDKYVESISKEIVNQIGGMFGSQGEASLNNQGIYSQTTYYNVSAKNDSTTDRAVSAFERSKAIKPTIKAGSTMYATLDAEANTDDGRTALATVRSGPWKGSKLIGIIEQSSNNITLNFLTMAPQDSRATMRIRAVALREADAKMGIAENIDHHTLSRYSALGAAALLQGAGRVYQQPVGTTISTPNGIITSNEPPQSRQVIGSAVGELGTAIGSEIRRRGFNQPSTYSTPAETGFVLYFLEDVVPNASNTDLQPHQQNPLLNPAYGNGATSPALPTAGFPQGGFNPNGSFGATRSGYEPGGYGANPPQSAGFGSNPYQAGGQESRNRGPLSANY